MLVRLADALERASDGREVCGVIVAMLFEWIVGVGGLFTPSVAFTLSLLSARETAERSSLGGAGLRWARSRRAGRSESVEDIEARVRGREGGVIEQEESSHGGGARVSLLGKGAEPDERRLLCAEEEKEEDSSGDTP